MADMYRLTGRVRHYVWGDRVRIPRFVGQVADGRPVAEVWFGAHPGAPAPALEVEAWYDGDGVSTVMAEPIAPSPLDALIAADPIRVLGESVSNRWGGRLPYLVKLLAAAEPLSLQVHPTREQAIEGLARELEAGVPAELRSYQDDNHKPETLVALVPTTVLAGFREPQDVCADLAQLAPGLPATVLEALRQDHLSPAARLRAGFGAVLGLSQGEVAAALAPLRSPDRAGPGASVERPGGRGVDSLALASAIAPLHPRDPGVLASVFLRPRVLVPGESVSVAAGVVHCYVQGFGLEVMATSDNVVRAGLTGKHLDVAELLRIVDFRPTPVVPGPAIGTPWSRTGRREQRAGSGPALVRAVHGGGDEDYVVAIYDVAALPGPTAELSERTGPRTVVGLDGQVAVVANGARAVLTAGDAVLVVDGPALRLAGRGRVAVVHVP